MQRACDEVARQEVPLHAALRRGGLHTGSVVQPADPLELEPGLAELAEALEPGGHLLLLPTGHRERLQATVAHCATKPKALTNP
jgi:hypothetical protein